MEYLDKLARDAGDRADLQRELAAGYLKLGDVLGRPFNPNLGDTAGALASYRKVGGDLRVARRGDARRITALRRELATAYLRLSEVLSSTGDTAEAAVVRQQGPGAADRRRAATRRCRPTRGASWSPATPASAICSRTPATRPARWSSGGAPWR